MKLKPPSLVDCSVSFACTCLCFMSKMHCCQRLNFGPKPFLLSAVKPGKVSMPVFSSVIEAVRASYPFKFFSYLTYTSIDHNFPHQSHAYFMSTFSQLKAVQGTRKQAPKYICKKTVSSYSHAPFDDFWISELTVEASKLMSLSVSDSRAHMNLAVKSPVIWLAGCHHASEVRVDCLSQDQKGVRN